MYKERYAAFEALSDNIGKYKSEMDKVRVEANPGSLIILHLNKSISSHYTWKSTLSLSNDFETHILSWSN